MRSKKKKKPLNTFMLHSKSTYFYTNWTPFCKKVSNLQKHLVRFCSEKRDFPSKTNNYMNLEHNGYLSTYILPAVCVAALLLVLGIAINPSICSVTQSFALEGGEEEKTNGSSVVSDVDGEGSEEAKESDTNISGDEVIVDSNENIAEGNSASENAVSAGDASSNARTMTSIAINWDVRDPEEQETHGSSGEVLYRYNRFTLSANKIKQYQILVNAATGSSNTLVGYLDAEHTTPLNAEVSGISNTNGVTGSNIPENQWGYALVKGDVTTEGGLANLNYKAVPSASDSVTALTGNEETLDNQEFTVAFGANVGVDKPAGHYTAYVTVSAVMEAKEMVGLGFAGYTTMQQINKTVCNGIAAGTEGRLRDTRDNKIYWVAKQDDGLCWMTQNLDYDGGGTRASNGTVGSSSDGGVAYYYDFGPYVDTNPISIALRCSGVVNLSDGMSVCTDWKRVNDSLITTAELEAEEARELHYHVGNHYNWSAATNGTSLALAGASGVATGSVCPSGWSLPLGYGPIRFQGVGAIIGYEVGTYGGWLYNKNIKTDETLENNITQKPYYFVRSGIVSNGGGGLDSVGGTWLEYTTATGSSQQANQAVYVFSTLSMGVRFDNYAPRGDGLSLRCVARWIEGSNIKMGGGVRLFLFYLMYSPTS